MDRYQKSISGIPCIGPCYKSGTTVIHPITLERISSNRAFCPTMRREIIDPKTKVKEIHLLDRCLKPTKNVDERDMAINAIVPMINFDCDTFLRQYYHITSFDQAVQWLETNAIASFFTKVRLLECAWKIYGLEINFLPSSVIQFYILFIKKYWIGGLYRHLNKYIVIENDKIRFGSSNDTNYDKHKVEKVNLIAHKLITDDNIRKFLLKYVEKNKLRWDDINNHHFEMEQFLKYYMERKVQTAK